LEIVCEVVDWIHVAKDWKWCVVNMVMNIWVT